MKVRWSSLKSMGHFEYNHSCRVFEAQALLNGNNGFTPFRVVGSLGQRH